MICTTVFLLCTLGAAATAEPGVRDGATVYKARCARCHGESGKTDTHVARAFKVRPLAHDAKLSQMTVAGIADAIKSDRKHQGMDAVTGLADSELEAVAVFVKKLAGRR